MNRRAHQIVEAVEEQYTIDPTRPGANVPRALEFISLHDDPTQDPPCALADGKPTALQLAASILAELDGGWPFDPRPYVVALVDSLGIYSGSCCDCETAWMVSDNSAVIAADYTRVFVSQIANGLIAGGLQPAKAICAAERHFSNRFGQMTAARTEEVRTYLVRNFGGICALTRSEFRRHKKSGVWN